MMSDSEWHPVTTGENEWQRVITNDNEWQRVIASGTRNENEWEQKNRVILSFQMKWKANLVPKVNYSNFYAIYNYSVFNNVVNL